MKTRFPTELPVVSTEPCYEQTRREHHIDRGEVDQHSVVPLLKNLPLAVSPAEAARLAGVGRTTLYAALGNGELASFKIGKRRLITVDALRNWLRSHGATL